MKNALGIIIFIGIIIAAAIFVLYRRTAIQPQTTPETQSTLQSPAPEALQPLSIESLRAFSQRVKAGEVKLEKTLKETPSYTSYAITYQSDGLKVTGYINVPKGTGPFPVIILNHGYFIPGRYQTGDGTRMEADYLAQRGYVTVAPDYRGYGGSDKAADGSGHLRNGYVLDVLNLIPALKKLLFIDGKKIGIWGHSMGAGIAQRVAVVTPEITATVLFAPRSGDLADEYQALSQSHDQFDKKLAADFKEVFGTPEDNPALFEKISPINFLNLISGPVMIHHSRNDNHNPFSWSEKLARALKNSGKEVEFIPYSGSQHTFAGETWQKAMEETLEFFNRNLK